MQNPLDTWHRTWWVVLAAVVFTICVGIIADYQAAKESKEMASKGDNLKNEAINIAVKELNKYVVHCGEYWYFKTVHQQLGFPPQYSYYLNLARNHTFPV